MSHLEKVRHDFIRYSNVWEDAEVLRRGLSIKPGDAVLSIASAGDNCFALLMDDPAIIVACDINITQLYLVKLKIAAINLLEYEQLKFFLGFTDIGESVERKNLFYFLKTQLDQDAFNYFNSNIHLIEHGIIHVGKFEKYFRTFAKYILPMIHSTQSIDELLGSKSSESQVDYFESRWNTFRWRFFFRLFFSKRLMGLLGRDPAFLNEIKGSVSEFILNRAAQHLKSTDAQDNFMLHYNLKGYFDDQLPDYIQSPENIELIRERTNRIKIFHGLIQEASAKAPYFDAMNLSDLFEYMPKSLFEDTAMKLATISRPGARLAYWNLMVDRDLSQDLPSQYIDCKLSDDLAKHDRGFYYKRFIVSAKR